MWPGSMSSSGPRCRIAALLTRASRPPMTLQGEVHGRRPRTRHRSRPGRRRRPRRRAARPPPRHGSYWMSPITTRPPARRRPPRWPAPTPCAPPVTSTAAPCEPRSPVRAVLCRRHHSPPAAGSLPAAQIMPPRAEAGASAVGGVWKNRRMDPFPCPEASAPTWPTWASRTPARTSLVVAAERPCAASAVFTRSRFSGPSVAVSRDHAADGVLQAVVVVSKNANVATGAVGLGRRRGAGPPGRGAVGLRGARRAGRLHRGHRAPVPDGSDPGPPRRAAPALRRARRSGGGHGA